MTDKVRKLLEEFGAAAAEPVHTEEEPKEHTPELSNDDVIDGQHAEEIKELIVESYELLESLGELSNEDFADLIDNSSYEDINILEEVVLAVEENQMLNEGIFRGKYYKFLNKNIADDKDRLERKYSNLVYDLNNKYFKKRDEVNKSISRGFLGLGGARAKYIKDTAAKRREELKADIAKRFEDAQKITDPRAKYQALLDARKAQDRIKKDAKSMAKKDFETFETKQKKSLEREGKRLDSQIKASSEKYDKDVEEVERVGKELKQKDWEDTSLLGGISKLFKPKPAPVVTTPTTKTKGTKPVVNTNTEMKPVSESFTRDELVELFEALELDTKKYTFEYLAEQLGFVKEENSSEKIWASKIKPELKKGFAQKNPNWNGDWMSPEQVKSEEEAQKLQKQVGDNLYDESM